MLENADGGWWEVLGTGERGFWGERGSQALDKDTGPWAMNKGGIIAKGNGGMFCEESTERINKCKVK